MTEEATGEASVKSRCLYAVSHDGTIVNERGGANIVPWWSFNKTVIAAAVLRLVQDGRLRLDDLLEGQPYSLSQLLQHRAGLPDYGALPEYHAAVARGDQPWPPSELLNRVGGDRLQYRPGNGWQYSNVGYLIVLQQIERTTGVDLDAALRQLVLDPLGVDVGCLSLKTTDLANGTMGAAIGYHPEWVFHGLLVGPVRSAAILLDRLIGTPFLAGELMEQMLKPHVVGGPIKERPWKVPGYGLGMMSGEGEDGHRVAGHTGGGPGSVIAVYPQMDSPSSGAAAAFLPGGMLGHVERAAFELAWR
jgi:CubicO group peptidase (beta-lactamase class C family)